MTEPIKKDTPRRPPVRLFTPLGLLVTAATLMLLFAICHLLGWREHTSFLSGTLPDDPHGNLRILQGILYVLTYFAVVLVAPILVLAATIFALLLSVTRPKAGERQND